MGARPRDSALTSEENDAGAGRKWRAHQENRPVFYWRPSRYAGDAFKSSRRRQLKREPYFHYDHSIHLIQLNQL